MSTTFRTRPLPLPQSDALIHDPNAGPERLLEIMRRLRNPDGGCPWDLEQSSASISQYTIEEAYEVVDAIDRADMADLTDELGDLLLQVVFHAQMQAEDGEFGFDDVVNAISEKMIRRHPHVFGDEGAGKTSAQQTVDWEKIKAAERAAKGKPEKPISALDGVAAGLPGMTRAVKLQKRAARVGFDWAEPEDVLDKLLEETRELVEARESLSASEVEAEFGDILFVMANLARHLDIDPENAIRRTNAKFIRRFEGIEAALRAKGRSPAESDLAEMDALWEKVKKSEKATD